MRAVLLIVLGFMAAGAVAQTPEAEERARAYAQSFGGQVLLTNSGFGLGLHVRMAMRTYTSLAGEVSLAAGKDAREVAFFDRFGRRDVLNKANHFLMMPMHAGIERRLFASRIEDDFRPFISLIGGPTLGWESPYFEDENENGILDPGEPTFDAIGALPKGHLKIGVGGTIAIGAHFGRDALSQGVRIGYSFARFADGVQLLERGIKEPQRWFGTPSIIVYFGRLW